MLNVDNAANAESRTSRRIEKIEKVEKKHSEQRKFEQKFVALNSPGKNLLEKMLGADSGTKFSGSDQTGNLDSESFRQKLKEAVDKLSNATEMLHKEEDSGIKKTDVSGKLLVNSRPENPANIRTTKFQNSSIVTKKEQSEKIHLRAKPSKVLDQKDLKTLLREANDGNARTLGESLIF